MGTRQRLLQSSLLPKVFVVVMVMSLFVTPQLLGQDSVKTKIHRIINNVQGIRDVFHTIAVRGRNEGAPGWERMVDFAEKAQLRINEIRAKFDGLADRLSVTDLPFPQEMNIPSHRVRILGRSVTFPGLNAPFRPWQNAFPNLDAFLSRFLDVVNQPLADMLDAAQDLDNELANALASAKANPGGRFSPSGSDSFPSAQYFYGPRIREWLGHPRVGQISKLYNAYVGGLVDAASEIFVQEIVVGGGGNLAVAKAILQVPKGLVNLVNELIGDVDGNITSSLVEGSYDRLEYIHFQVDTVDQKVEIVDDKVDTLTSQFNDWRTLSIRTRIEINLSGHGDHPHPIAIFLLPAQFGGYLELARDIVQETINNMLAAGENIYQAAFFLSRGNAEFAAGRYKKAYNWYGKSYLEATK